MMRLMGIHLPGKRRTVRKGVNDRYESVYPAEVAKAAFLYPLLTICADWTLQSFCPVHPPSGPLRPQPHIWYH